MRPASHRGSWDGALDIARMRSLMPQLRGGLLTVGPLLLLLVAAIAMLISRPSAPVIGALSIVLACIAALIGWRLGGHSKAALHHEIERRALELKRALSELEVAQAETVRRLSMAVEFRDEDTGAHIERIGRFSALLAGALGMDPDFCERLSHAAPLHDVGKVAIPDAILLKPGPLTPQERAIVETHAEEGHRLLSGSSSSILDLAASVALSHHERWDGGGYPRGLAGELIPIEGRIVAIADVFDALTSERVYRKAFSVQEAEAMMLAQRGRHFDPTLLDAFLEVLGSSGPEARPAREQGDAEQVIEEVSERYTAAIQRADAETAEGVIAQAIEDGMPPITLHEMVIHRGLRVVAQHRDDGELDASTATLAVGISRRILATMHRYMLRGAEPTRERVLVLDAERDARTLSAQMVHDELAAAGFQTILDAADSLDDVLASLESERPEVIVLCAGAFGEQTAIARICAELSRRSDGVRVLVQADRDLDVDELIPAADGEGMPARIAHLYEAVGAVEAALRTPDRLRS